MNPMSLYLILTPLRTLTSLWVHTSDDSWAAQRIGRRYSTPFAASTSTSLSKYIQPAQAEGGRGPTSTVSIQGLCL
jgi:hypothetical protein